MEQAFALCPGGLAAGNEAWARPEQGGTMMSGGQRSRVVAWEAMLSELLPVRRERTEAGWGCQLRHGNPGHGFPWLMRRMGKRKQVGAVRVRFLNLPPVSKRREPTNYNCAGLNFCT